MPEKALAAVTVVPNRMELREIDLPEIGNDEGLVRIEAAGICGTDYGQFTGDRTGSRSMPYPLILGHEPLGTIAVIGEEASRRWGVTVGDRVAVISDYHCGRCQVCQGGTGEPCPDWGYYGHTGLERPPGLWGGYAEYMYLSPGAKVHPMDKTLPAEVAAMFNPMGAGFAWAVEAPDLQPGQSIAILGPGQRGLCSVIAAREAGASFVAVTGLGRDEHKLALARELGADVAIDAEVEDPVERVKDATGGRGVDVVLDASSYSVEAVAQAVRMARKGGTVVLAGIKAGRPMEGLSSDEIVHQQLTIKGVIGVEFSAFKRGVDAIESRLEATEQAILTQAGKTNEPAIHVAVIPRRRD